MRVYYKSENRERKALFVVHNNKKKIYTMSTNKLATARHILMSADYRSLSPHEKAAKLVVEKHCSVRVAAEATGLSKSAVHRAIKSSQMGWSVGHQGRPYLFSLQEEAELERFLAERAQAGSPVNYSEFHNKVSDEKKILIYTKYKY